MGDSQRTIFNTGSERDAKKGIPFLATDNYFFLLHLTFSVSSFLINALDGVNQRALGQSNHWRIRVRRNRTALHLPPSADGRETARVRRAVNKTSPANSEPFQLGIVFRSAPEREVIP